MPQGRARYLLRICDPEFGLSDSDGLMWRRRGHESTNGQSFARSAALMSPPDARGAGADFEWPVIPRALILERKQIMRYAGVLACPRGSRRCLDGLRRRPASRRADGHVGRRSVRVVHQRQAVSSGSVIRHRDSCHRSAGCLLTSWSSFPSQYPFDGFERLSNGVRTNVHLQGGFTRSRSDWRLTA